MEKILFFIPNLMHGGAEKVLVNLVNNLDRDKYNITLQTIFDVGVNKQYLKEDINYKYVFKSFLEEVQLYSNCFLLNFYTDT